VAYPDGLPTTRRYRTDEDDWLRLPSPNQADAYNQGQPMPPGVATPDEVESLHYAVHDDDDDDGDQNGWEDDDGDS
jgi:hypothetical protein